MLKLKNQIAIITLFGLAIAYGNAFAHTTVVPKNTPDGYETRDNLEGQSSFNLFSIPHGCNGIDVKAQSIVFPNGEDDVAVKTDTDESVELADHIIGNPVMGPKPVYDNRIFKDISVKRGAVPLFEDRGEKTEDIRAFVFTDGRLPNEFMGLIPWRTTFPGFKPESCATSLKVNIAIANYCTNSIKAGDNDRADIWIGNTTSKFDDPDVVSVGFWPFLNVIRDLENNPISESCGEGFELMVTPSSEALDEFLPIHGFWPAAVCDDE